MISISSYYGKSPSAENNAKCVIVNDVRFYFSYETLVGIETPDRLNVIQNQWGPTTGKHLNAIDSGSEEAKANRLTSEEFQKFAQEFNMVLA
jgi:hypothetical protein